MNIAKMLLCTFAFLIFPGQLTAEPAHCKRARDEVNECFRKAREERGDCNRPGEEVSRSGQSCIVPDPNVNNGAISKRPREAGNAGKRFKKCEQKSEQMLKRGCRLTPQDRSNLDDSRREDDQQLQIASFAPALQATRSSFNDPGVRGGTDPTKQPRGERPQQKQKGKLPTHSADLDGALQENLLQRQLALAKDGSLGSNTRADLDRVYGKPDLANLNQGSESGSNYTASPSQHKTLAESVREFQSGDEKQGPAYAELMNGQSELPPIDLTTQEITASTEETLPDDVALPVPMTPSSLQPPLAQSEITSNVNNSNLPPSSEVTPKTEVSSSGTEVKPEGSAQKETPSEELSFFSKLGDIVLDFFGIEDKEKTDDEYREDSNTAQHDPLAHDLASIKVSKEELAALDVNPPTRSKKAKADLPVVVLDGKPQFDATRVAEQVQEVEKKDRQRELTTKTLQELAQEAKLQQSSILEDNQVTSDP